MLKFELSVLFQWSEWAVDFDLEEALYMFSWRFVLHCRICVLPHHVIDGSHDVKHLLQSEGQKTKKLLTMKKVFTRRVSNIS